MGGLIEGFAIVIVVSLVGAIFVRVIINSDFFEEYGAWIVGIGLLMLIVMFP